MLRIKQIMAIARAESLITIRQLRYWVFIGMAYFTASILYLIWSAMHGYYSSYSGIIGALSPRFLLSIIGLFYLLIFLFGAVFMAFDIRARDKRDGIIDVLDSKPFTNLELVTGRFLGIFICSWIPIIVLVTLFELIGFIMKNIGIPLGEPVEIFSIFSFVFIMVVPALSFVIALIFFVTLFVRNRLAAAVILLATIGLFYWALFWLPAVYGELFDIVGISATVFCSEIVPRFAYSGGWIQRLSVLFAAFSLLGFSALIHPRLDGGSRLKLLASSISVMIAAFFLLVSCILKMTDMSE